MPSILPQLIVNGLIAGAIYALAASGFSLVYYVIKFQYFSHGAIMSISAYLFFAFLNQMGLNYLLSAFLVVLLAIIITLTTNWLVYLPLRKRKATPVITLIASIALLIFLSSLVLAVFGSSTKSILLAKAHIFNFEIFTITSVQVSIILTSLVLFIFLWVILKKTKLGKAMRALADNKDAAQTVGIDPEKIYKFTFALAAILGAVGGILLGIEQNLYPRMGIIIIIKGFISSVVGGLGSVPGSIIGGFFIGLVENVGILYLPSGYKDVISFSVMVVFLLFRPQGIFGVKMRDDN